MQSVENIASPPLVWNILTVYIKADQKSANIHLFFYHLLQMDEKAQLSLKKDNS